MRKREYIYIYIHTYIYIYIYKTLINVSNVTKAIVILLQINEYDNNDK